MNRPFLSFMGAVTLSVLSQGADAKAALNMNNNTKDPVVYQDATGGALHTIHSGQVPWRFVGEGINFMLYDRHHQYPGTHDPVEYEFQIRDLHTSCVEDGKHSGWLLQLSVRDAKAISERHFEIARVCALRWHGDVNTHSDVIFNEDNITLTRNDNQGRTKQADQASTVEYSALFFWMFGNSTQGIVQKNYN